MPLRTAMFLERRGLALVGPLLQALVLTVSSESQQPVPGRGLSVSAPVETRPARIQWFGTLAQGLAEAERTGRPILLSAATLRCEGVPGKW